MRPRSRRFLVQLGVAVGFFVLGSTGQLLMLSRSSGLVITPAAGIAPALVLIFGTKIWPALFAGAMGTGIFYLVRGSVPVDGLVAFALVATSAARTAAPVLATAILRRLLRGRAILFDLRATLLYVAVCGVAYPLLIGGTLALGMFAARTRPPGQEPFWVFADATLAASAAALIFGPALLLAAAPRRDVVPRRPLAGLEAALVALLLAGASLVVFRPADPVPGGYPPIHLAAPLLLWAALRFGAAGAVSGTFLVAVIGVIETLATAEPLVREEAVARVQILLEVLSTTLLLLGAALHESRANRIALEAERRSLEDRVAARSASLRAQREFSDRVIETLGALVAVLDVDGRLVHVNRAFERATGWTDAEIAGRCFWELRPPEEREQAWRNFGRLLEGGPVRAPDVHILKRDGGRIDADFASAPIRDAEGRVRGVLTTALDVTDRNRARAELASSISLVRATLESSRDGILVVDRARRGLLHNRRFAEIWGLQEPMERKDDVPALEHILKTVADPEEFERRRRWLNDHPELESDDVIELADGRILERSTRPHRVGGEVRGRVSTYRDVTRRRRAEAERDRLLLEERLAREETERAYEDVRRAMQVRDRFLDAASQEIERPLRELEACVESARDVAGLSPDEVEPGDLLPIVEAALRELAGVQTSVDRLLRIPEETGLTP